MLDDELIEGQTNDELATLVTEKKEEKVVSNKEIKEQKEKEKKEEESKAKYVDPYAGMTAEEKEIALKKKRQEEDMKAAEEMYGSVNDFKQLDTMAVITDADYRKFGELLGLKGQSLYKPKNKQYLIMVKECIKQLVAELPTADVKEVSTSVDRIFNEKLQADKEKDKKKKKSSAKKQPTLNVGKATQRPDWDFDDNELEGGENVEGNEYDEYDDFM